MAEEDDNRELVGLDLCYEKLIFVFHIEIIALFFMFEVQKIVFHSLDLNPSGSDVFVTVSTSSEENVSFTVLLYKQPEFRIYGFNQTVKGK